ncbi:stage III sporulation protein AH [Fontibacillus phaseoli]|uniref:Stage III sporulation protein AH n=1 Tax=Fontibacillus phaseoli TaxID=1416533 RepID=A0A369BRC9_9BACL|nr:SpoIIIAH-like family protein [Fontibacillus phaseoli]RCX23146.1 stage III sporulation protein AH [Fontibacillus phaseoli]
MKSKRQTVWLVSMLSLMVVLSAYYLFTEDNSSKNQAADGQQVTTMDSGQNQETVTGDESIEGDEVILSEVTGEGEENPVIMDGEIVDPAQTPEAAAGTKTPDASDSDKASGNSDTKQSEGKTENQNGTDPSSSNDSTAAKDEDVLKQLETQGVSGTDSLTAYQFQRSDVNAKKLDELMQTINDSSKTLDEAAMAQKELGALEEKEEKIYDIEEKLQQKYANAVVTESDNKYKVLVVSEKLAANEAVGIMDLVIKELGISQDKVSVQYVTQ